MKQLDTAIIIAGGKSTRMGFDKAFMKIGKTSCVELIVRRLKKHFNEIIVVTNEQNKFELADVKTTHDKIKNAGPLGGLHAGLKISSSLYNYLIACDMPVISDELIAHMKNMLFLEPDIIACKNNDFIEPFHGVYGKHLTLKIEQEIKTGQCSLFNLMLKSKTEVISKDTIKKMCKNLNLFTNLNTRQELAQFTSKEVKHPDGSYANI